MIQFEKQRFYNVSCDLLRCNKNVIENTGKIWHYFYRDNFIISE